MMFLSKNQQYETAHETRCCTVGLVLFRKLLASPYTVQWQGITD